MVFELDPVGKSSGSTTVILIGLCALCGAWRDPVLEPYSLGVRSLRFLRDKLGAEGVEILLRIELPVLAPSAVAGGTIVFLLIDLSVNRVRKEMGLLH